MITKEKGLYVAVIVLMIAMASLSGYTFASSQQHTPVYSPVLQGTGTESQKNTLSVTGSGLTSVESDLAKVSLGVTTQATTATDAIQQNAQKMTQIINALKGLGISEDDMTTQRFNLYPVYSSKPEIDPPTILAYRVSNVIVIDVHDLKIVGKVIDTATGAGANEVQGVSFTLSDKEYKKIKISVLQIAAEDAKTKAETMATSLGVEIIGVLQISESGFWYQQNRVLLDGASASPAAPETPIKPGDVQVSATIQVTYIIQ